MHPEGGWQCARMSPPAGVKGFFLSDTLRLVRLPDTAASQSTYSFSAVKFVSLAFAAFFSRTSALTSHEP
jgi:hypothetical protein